MSQTAKLGDVAEVVAGVGFPKDMQGRTEGDIPVFKVGDISAAWTAGERVLRASRNYLLADQALKLGRPVPAGSTVFAKIGEALRLNRRAVLGQPSLVDNNVMGLVPRVGALTPMYLFYFMQTVDLGKLSRATAVPSIRQSDVAEIDIPLPSLSEQARVVDEIDKQFSRLDEAVKNLKRVTASQERYRNSVLSAAADGSIVGQRLPAAVPICSIIAMLDQGWSPQCESEPASNSEHWAVIKTTAIQPMEFLAEQNKRLPGQLEARPGLELRAGDLLVTRAGPRSRVGVACTVRSTRPRLMLCDKAYRVRFNTAMAEARYMEIVLNAPAVREAINGLKTGMSDSGVNLTQKRFGELRVPVPSLALQACIVADVDRRLSIVREVEAEIQVSLERARALRQAVLGRAFGS